MFTFWPWYGLCIILATPDTYPKDRYPSEQIRLVQTFCYSYQIIYILFFLPLPYNNYLENTNVNEKGRTQYSDCNPKWPIQMRFNLDVADLCPGIYMCVRGCSALSSCTQVNEKLIEKISYKLIRHFNRSFFPSLF